MNSLFIEHIWCNEIVSDVFIENRRFARILPTGQPESVLYKQRAKKVIDGSGKALLPAFYNGHTHAAMTLLRGYADDMPLQTWLQDHIWPAEACMTADDMRVGVQLAVLEMIHSGTVFFNDMYFKWRECLDVVEEMGIRACVADSLIDAGNPSAATAYFKSIESLPSGNGRIQWAVSPHAVYTVSGPSLQACAEMARERGLKLHTHLAETQQEYNDCLAAHGMTPTQWMHQHGMLSPNLIAAHAIYLNEEDMSLLAEHHCTVVHNPCSNMKLASGIFPSADLQRHGVRIALGTDGTASNNNLDMHEEMKLAALLGKLRYGADAVKAEEAFAWATRNGAEAFGIDAGILAENKSADALIVKLSNERMAPKHHLLSNWVYAADNRSLDSVLCDGELLMENGRVPHEEAIIEEANRCAHRLVKKVRR